MGGTAANRITTAISGADGKTLGAVFGAEGITLTTAQLPAHNHGFTTGTVSSDHSHSGNTGGRSAGHVHTVSWYNFSGGAGAGGSGTYQGEVNTSYENVDHSHGFTTGGISANHTHSGTTNNTGSGSVVQNSQPSIVVNVFMRVT
jgi:microcystin-dependent protein